MGAAGDGTRGCQSDRDMFVGLNAHDVEITPDPGTGAANERLYAMREKPPNILVIMSDQQCPESLACYGNVFVHSPNIDSLASSGERWTPPVGQ